MEFAMFFSPVGSRRFSYASALSPVLGATCAVEYQPTAANAEFSITENGYCLSVDVPGLAKEQLRIEVDGRVVRIASLDDAPRSFNAAYRFPLALDAEATTAKLEHGVLSLSLVGLAPANKAKTVTIQ
jgi:HSP20 family protein